MLGADTAAREGTSFMIGVSGGPIVRFGACSHSRLRPEPGALAHMRTECSLQDIPLISMHLDQIQPRLDDG
jgi:hypothetical protein